MGDMNNNHHEPRAHFGAPFEVRSFRFQWPADLAASWAIEMEVLILGWYVLVTSDSVMWLVGFGALLYIGTLASPLLGVLADRLGHRVMLCCTRGIYAALSLCVVALAQADALTPAWVLAVSCVTGLIRPSDLMIRYALIAQSMPPAHLMGALGVSRATSDSARIAGALTGAGAVAQWGMTWAYAVVTALYLISVLLSWHVAPSVRHPSSSRGSAWVTPFIELRLAVVYALTKPALLGTWLLAFLVNMLAFPFFLGLLPYIAKEVYQVDQTGLGWMGASFAAGALMGSLCLGSNRISWPAGRLMLTSALIWFAMVMLFGQLSNIHGAMILLVVCGLVQSACLTPMAALMLRDCDVQYHGRVMGLRILAVLGLPLGLMLSGAVVRSWGLPLTSLIFGLTGMGFTALLAWHWRAHLWRTPK
ncbi:MAG: MFS transporter [Betaproteobacteria bacterium]|jgi:predicted MFS family arabinose efflux permease|nr:MFS transporter [Betaproteobacteria bacterium]NBX88820.1 MFS transporter [Betaproteobacteria bacterium]